MIIKFRVSPHQNDEVVIDITYNATIFSLCLGTTSNPVVNSSVANGKKLQYFNFGTLDSRLSNVLCQPCLKLAIHLSSGKMTSGLPSSLCLIPCEGGVRPQKLADKIKTFFPTFFSQNFANSPLHVQHLQLHREAFYSNIKLTLSPSFCRNQPGAIRIY